MGNRATVPGAPSRKLQTVFALYLLLLAVALLFPVGPRRIDQFLSLRQRAPLWRNLVDGVGNIALFLPVGFLGRHVLRERRRVSWKTDLYLIASGLVFSLAAECAQYFIPGRYSSLRDVVMNGVGTAAGVALEAFVVRLSGTTTRRS